ncbi:hypothetical protein HNR65_002558 [Desulfosalsimonas propionicica]|uniref:PilZ domain-containing protein n=1 Tax=Desulfosalsimonas propionicica TaxID=332175 RepID=A0A7W0CAM0_9BACT|nr:PilZ domain-containing protein [Desulfosalsimonas propionicica]MBA2882217.1 hypothetical protein [Desulfosalsimonas propionicica]
MTTLEKRSEERLPLESATLPLLGSRQEDFQPFQYLVQDLSANGVRIAIPSWAQRREKLYRGDAVNLHLPYQLYGQSKNQGIVAWENWDPQMQIQSCGISLHRHFPETYPVYISLETREAVVNLSVVQSVANILCKVLKDAVLLKRGLLIYMEHLVAYLTRVSRFSKKEYADFRGLIIEDIQSGLKDNLRYLEALYQDALNAASEHEIFDRLDIDDIRKKMEPELYVDLFRSVLDSEIIQRYLVALKVLEKKGFNNYNTLVILYVNSL